MDAWYAAAQADPWIAFYAGAIVVVVVWTGCHLVGLYRLWRRFGFK